MELTYTEKGGLLFCDLVLDAPHHQTSADSFINVMRIKTNDNVPLLKALVILWPLLYNITKKRLVRYVFRNK